MPLRAITFDDFLTLRFPVEEGEDIIFPILKALKRQELDVNDEEFLKQYFKENELYRKRLKETHRESLLDDIVMKVLAALGHEPKPLGGMVMEAVRRLSKGL